MEFEYINNLLARYFEGETTIAEEKALKAYFTGADVDPRLEQYQMLFATYHKQAHETTQKVLTLPKPKSNFYNWGIAASIALVIGLAFTLTHLPNKHQDLGTFDDPQQALIETQKALQLIAENINRGKENMQYLNEYQNTKQTIFKQ